MEGLRLASAGDDIKLWDCGEEFSLIHQYNPHNQNIASVSWNFEGSFLASCALSDEEVAITYIKNEEFKIVKLPCGTGVQSTDFSSGSCNSRFLVCGGADGVSVWDLKSKTVKKSFKEHKGPVTAVRYNWNDTYIASASETGEIILHNIVTGQSSSPLVAANAQAIRQLEYSVFKKSMFGTASDDGAITLWDANTRHVLHSFKDAHLGPATGVAFSPINEMLMMSVGLDKRVVCYDIQKRNVLKVIDAQSPLTCIDIMPDGATAAVGSTRGKIYIYDLRQGGGTPMHTFQAHKTSVHSVHFMPTAKLKNDEAGGVKTSVPAGSGSRRQLPPAPGVMQDITPQRQGQIIASDTLTTAHQESPPHTVDVFSPTVEGGHSHHSLSAVHLNLTNSRGEVSLPGGGVFSPLTNGAMEHSASCSLQGPSSLFSTPSFLGQRTSHLQSPSLHHTSSHVLSPLVTQNSSHQAANGVNMLPSAPVDNSANRQTGSSPRALPPHISSPQGSGASPSLPRSQQFTREVTFSDVPAAVSFSTSVQPAVPSLKLSHLQDSALISGGEEGDTDRGSHPRRDVEDAQSSPSPHSSLGGSPRHGSLIQSHSALRKMVKADLREYREQLRQEFSAVLWGSSGQGPGSSAAGARAGGGDSVTIARDVSTFQSEFLRNLVTDAMEEVRDDIHHHIQCLHVEMIRQFHDFQREIQSQLMYYAQMNQDLLLHVRRLEEENRKLKKRF